MTLDLFDQNPKPEKKKPEAPKSKPIEPAPRIKEAPVTVEVKEKADYDLHYEKEFALLNKEQKAAVEQIEGPVLVLAGPGTGKTQIIAARIGHILRSKEAQAAPHNILCLTYTDSGAIAMRQRLLKLIGPVAYRVHIYTFHAFCNEIIQNNLDFFGKRELEPISELEQVILLQDLIDSLDTTHPIRRLKGDAYFEVPRLQDLFRKMKEEDWNPELISDRIDTYLAEIPEREEYLYKQANQKRNIKKGDIKEAQYQKEVDRMELLRAAAQLYPSYQKLMKERGRYDYSDMILWVLEAFKQDPELLMRYQEQYLYFLVDEFQDTNGSQNEILRSLIDFWDNPNIFVVGDDDQSIFEFQGARVRNILDLFKDYRDHIKVIVLKDNYRSSQNILDASAQLIKQNTQRLIHEVDWADKQLYAQHPEFASSDIKPLIVEYPNLIQEEADLVSQISELQKQNVPLSEVAVLYRKNNQVDDIIKILERKGIPYQARKKIDILTLPFIHNILNILRYLQAEFEKPHSGEHLLFEMMHYRFFEIDPRDAARISHTCSKSRKPWREFLSESKHLTDPMLKLKTPHRVAELEAHINNWINEVPNVTLQKLVENIVNHGGILRYIMNDKDKIWLMQVLNTFFDLVKKESAKHPKISIRSLVETISQMEHHRIPLEFQKTIVDEDGVQLMTVHAAKGLEFQYVFVIGSTRNLWESTRGETRNYKLPDTLTYTLEENRLESARRLFYVAMSRAKEKLQLSFGALNRDDKEQEPSGFVHEILSGSDIEISSRKVDEETVLDFSLQTMSSSDGARPILAEASFIDKLLENYSMSISHLNHYLKCPVGFYYEKILRVPAAKNEAMAFGGAVHLALEGLFRKMGEHPDQRFPSEKEFLEFFMTGMNKNRDSFTDKQFERRVAYGEQMLPLYYQNYIKNWNKVTIVEYKIRNVEVDGIPLNGKLDKLEFNGNEVNVVDYKTGNAERGLRKLAAPTEKDPMGKDTWRQVVFYKILMDNVKGKAWTMVSGEVDFVEQNQTQNNRFEKQKIQATSADIIKVKGQISDVYQKIMAHEFSDGCLDCDWCSFVDNNFSGVSIPMEIDEEL